MYKLAKYYTLRELKIKNIYFKHTKNATKKIHNSIT